MKHSGTVSMFFVIEHWDFHEIIYIYMYTYIYIYINFLSGGSIIFFTPTWRNDPI